MADLLIALSLMFAGAALALGGFALGQSVERRRWLEWTRPKRVAASVTYSADGAVTYRERRDA